MEIGCVKDLGDSLNNFNSLYFDVHACQFRELCTVVDILQELGDEML